MFPGFLAALSILPLLEHALTRHYAIMLGLAALWVMAAGMSSWWVTQAGYIVAAIGMVYWYVAENREALTIKWCDFVAKRVM